MGGSSLNTLSGPFSPWFFILLCYSTYCFKIHSNKKDVSYLQRVQTHYGEGDGEHNQCSHGQRTNGFEIMGPKLAPQGLPQKLLRGHKVTLTQPRLTSLAGKEGTE